MPSVLFEKIPGVGITEDFVKQAAELFSSSYGVWNTHVKAGIDHSNQAGARVEMSPASLVKQILPQEVKNMLVRATLGEELIGNVFATSWEFDGKMVCWITQLCVKEKWRRRGLATQLLRGLKQGQAYQIYGILSSHPAAIMAATRAFSHGIEHLNFDLAKKYGKGIMAASPVDYVKSARLNGSIFEKFYDVCYAFTDFWIDHKEPSDVLASAVKNGRGWPLGQLPDGCEYLALVDGGERRRSASEEIEELEIGMSPEKGRWRTVVW